MSTVSNTRLEGGQQRLGRELARGAPAPAPVAVLEALLPDAPVMAVGMFAAGPGFKRSATESHTPCGTKRSNAADNFPFPLRTQPAARRPPKDSVEYAEVNSAVKPSFDCIVETQMSAPLRCIWGIDADTLFKNDPRSSSTKEGAA